MMNSYLKDKSSRTLDLAGIFFSGACAVHCMLGLALPFLVPTLTVQLENEWLHILLLFLILPVSGFSFYIQRKAHKQNLPLMLGLSGIIILFSALFIEKLFALEIESLEVTITIIGSVLLILGHFLNMRSKATCNS